MTLVEIMITMLISSIIAASTFVFFAGQQRIYETQTKVINIQQNLWAAMEVIARHTRASGSGMYGCVKPASYADATAGNGTRKQSTFPSPGPLTQNLDTPPQTGIRAYDPSSGSTTHMQWIPPLWIVNNDAATSPTDAALNVLAGTDVITVAFGNGTSGTDTDIQLGYLVTTDPSTPIPLLSAGTGSMFRLGEFVLLLRFVDPGTGWGYGEDPAVDRGCTLFQITSTPLDAALPHQNGSGGSVWNPPLIVGAAMLQIDGTNGYAAGTAGVRNFGALTWISFFIQRAGASGIPYLMMQQRHVMDSDGKPQAPQVLAEGIEDLQVSFACDTGTLATHNLTQLDGVLNEGADNATHTNDAARQSDEWWNNVPNDPPIGGDGFCNSPTAVRITMVARSLAEDDLIDASLGNGPLDIEDHRQPSPRPTDSFRRRVLSTTVYPRNNKPQ